VVELRGGVGLLEAMVVIFVHVAVHLHLVGPGLLDWMLKLSKGRGLNGDESKRMTTFLMM